MFKILPIFAVLNFAVLAGCAQIGSFFPSLSDYTNNTSEEISDKASICNIRAGRPLSEPGIKSNACIELRNAERDYQDLKTQSAELKFKSAIDLYRSGDRSINFKDYRSAWFSLAASYDVQGKFKDADYAYQFILDTFGKSIRYHNNFGYSLFLRKDEEGARREWMAGLALDPENQTLLDNISALSNP